MVRDNREKGNKDRDGQNWSLKELEIQTLYTGLKAEKL